MNVLEKPKKINHTNAKQARTNDKAVRTNPHHTHLLN